MNDRDGAHAFVSRGATRRAPTDALWHAIGRQLRHPRGLSGRIAGNVMRIANGRPNALAIAALKIEPADDILELGFGPGHAIATMASLAPFGTIHGIDQSAAMLGQARERNFGAIRAGRVFLRHGRFEELPLPDASVDKILAVNVIYFWDDAPAVVREMLRVLRPGGLVSVYATDSCAMRRWKFASAATHRLFDAEEIAALLRQGGFDRDDIEVTKIGAGFGVPGLIATVRKH